jgi:hypothetical protein
MGALAWRARRAWRSAWTELPMSFAVAGAGGVLAAACKSGAAAASAKSAESLRSYILPA